MKAVNLLPPDLRGKPSKATAQPSIAPDVERSAGPYVVLGALALCVAAIAGYVLTGNTIEQRKVEVAALAEREQAVMQQAAKLKPYADFQSLASERVSTVRDLAGQRFDWEQSLRDLSRAIPANVTLSSLDGTVSASGGTAGGAGGSGLRSAIDAPAIELKGCTRNQREVATLMARLRNIDGVTRVSLAKSEEKETASTPAPAAGTAAPTEVGCGSKGSPPDFEMVLFFEGATNAAAAGSSAAPVAAATPAASATPANGTTPPADPATPASTQEGATP